MIYLNDYIIPDGINFIQSSTKEEALEEMIESLKEVNTITDFQSFKKAIHQREEILSTGIGNNVAIPHVKLKEIDDFFIAIGIHKEGMEWDSIDNKPVHLIFLIGGPEDQTRYLRILAKLTLIIKNPEVRSKILACEKIEEINAIFKKY